MHLKNLINKKWFLRISLPVIAVSIITACIVSFVVIKPKYSTYADIIPTCEQEGRDASPYEMAEICEQSRTNEVYSKTYYRLKDAGISIDYKTIQKDFYADYVAMARYIRMYVRLLDKDQAKTALNIYMDVAIDYYNNYAKEKTLKISISRYTSPSEPQLVNNHQFQYLAGIILCGSALGLIAGGYVSFLQSEKEKKNETK